MALNYSSKHDISYANYNNKNIPWKLNTSIISQNNQITNPSLNLGTINNNLVIESSQNDILFLTSQNNNKKVIVKNNMAINNLDVSNNLTTNRPIVNDISLNNRFYFPSLPINIIGDLKVDGAITVIGSTSTGLTKSETKFINSILTNSKFTDVSIVDCNISDSSFSNVNIINSYIYNIPNGYGYDKSNNSYPNKAIFSDVSLDNLVLDSYINFDANASNSISIRSYDYDDYSRLEINKPLTVESGIRIGENISNISVFNGDISCITLYYSQLFPDIKLNNYFDVSIGQVSLSGNNIPVNNSFNIGSTNYKFNEIISTNYDGNLSGAATSANDLVKNLDMSFNNLDIYGTITLNRQNLNQFLSSDLLSINAAIIDFSNANKSVRDLSASLYSKAGFDLCLNTNFTKNRLVELSFTQLNNRIISISNIVYTKSDFDLCLNRNVLRTNDLSAIVAVVTNPGEIYPTLGYIDSSLNKITNSKVTNELAFPYAITYVDDLVEDTNLKESYSYRVTTNVNTSTSTTITSTAVTNITITTKTGTYIGPKEGAQPNNLGIYAVVMCYAKSTLSGNENYRKWFGSTSGNSTIRPAVYSNFLTATFDISTVPNTWANHRNFAQLVNGRFLATILDESDNNDLASIINGSSIADEYKTYLGVWIGARRRTTSTNAYGITSTDWGWIDGTYQVPNGSNAGGSGASTVSWNYSNFYRGGQTQDYPITSTTNTSYTVITPGFPSIVPSSLPTTYQDTDTSNTKMPCLVSSLGGTIVVTATAVASFNIPFSSVITQYSNNISSPSAPVTSSSVSYLVYSYEVNTENRSWDWHRQNALDLGRSLAVISNPIQNEQVRAIITGWTFIGGKRKVYNTNNGSSSAWEWTNGNPWVYTNWDSGEPGTNEDTVKMNTIGKWHDWPGTSIGPAVYMTTTTNNDIKTETSTSTTSVTQTETTTITTETVTINGNTISSYATNGGTKTTFGPYTIHSYTTVGSFTYTPPTSGTVEVLIVGGGGGGGPNIGGGGGGGGVVYMPAVQVNVGQNYTIEVGDGGPSGTIGQPSKAFGAIAAGGGTSGSYPNSDGTIGGSGGGAAANETRQNLGGGSSYNSLGTNSGTIYGNRGGNVTGVKTDNSARAAGGGGAGGPALDTDVNWINTDQTGRGSGGVGVINNILGPNYYWGGGGGGGTYGDSFGGWGGLGGGGGGGAAYTFRGGPGGGSALISGSKGSEGVNLPGGAGGANTGGGGGGGCYGNTSLALGGKGGSGIVIIRYSQPGSFKISENDNNKFNYIKSSASALPTTIPSNYLSIAISNDGMFVALGSLNNVTVYMRNSTGWTTLGSPISINFTAYTNTDCNILWNGFDSAMYKNLQNLAINYITGSNVLDIYLAFGDARSSVKLYSYTYSGTSVLSNGFYNISTSGTWVTDTSRTRTPNIAVGETSNTNFGYFVTLSHNPIVLGFTVDDKFYTYNTSNNNIRGSRKTLSLPTDYSPTTKNIVAFKVSSDAEKIIVSNTYYVFVYKWNINITDWMLVTTISLLSTTYNSIITFTYGTSTTKRTAAPRSLDISNISSDECVFAIGFPDVLIDTSANRRSRGYVEYWKLTNTILTRLATLVPRKRNIDSSNIDIDEYFFSGGGIKITNANTILVAPNFKFHFNNNKNFELDTSNVNWANHNINAKSISGREMASIENEADNELVKISARNNVVWIGAKRTALDAPPSGITSSHWQWSDLSSIWNYTSFASGQPNSFFEKRIQSASGSWYDTLDSATLRAVYMTRLQYSLNTFSIFDKFYFHSSGFSSSYANTAISTTLIAKWRTTDTLNRSIDFKANGSIVSNGKGIFTISDIRLKENIVDSTPKLEDLLKVRVVNYNLKGCKDNKLIGVVAQELEQVFPTLVNDGELSMHDIYLGKTESYKSVKYSCFDVILIKAFQEHVAIINKLTSQLDEIECKTKLLKAINKDYFILKQELDLLKSENELFKLNINEILKLI